MLSAPGDLGEGALAGALQREWGIGVAVMAYRAVGWAAITGRLPGRTARDGS